MNEKTVKGWVQKAESDLKTGKDEMATADPATDTVCFHMQQCAEKYLKAFLIYHGHEITRTHNIASLIDTCSEIEAQFSGLLELGAHKLTRYAVAVRCPDEVLFPSMEHAREAVALAEKVKEVVLAKLKNAGFEPWT
ncbi:MAG: HEPN domain-containing protein [Chloroflexi bacterium]|nr:HEPN domain-containing protein [Chloroflexota bacterium]